MRAGLRQLFHERAKGGWPCGYQLEQVSLHVKKLGSPTASNSWQALVTIRCAAGRANDQVARDLNMVLVSWWAKVSESVDQRGYRMCRLRWYTQTQ